MREASDKLVEESKYQGILCTGPHGLLLTSSGIADASKAGFVASLSSGAEALHPQSSPAVVTIETNSR